MTKLGSSGSTGSVHFPYQSANDNHYAIGSTNKDVLQCRVAVTRTSGDNYQGTVYDVNGKAQGTASAQLTTDEQSFNIPGKGGLLDLAVIRSGEMGKVGTVGSRVGFNYGAASFAVFELGTDLFWTTVSQGLISIGSNPDIDTYADHHHRLGRGIEQAESRFAARWILHRAKYF